MTSTQITIKEYMSAPAVQDKMKEVLLSDRMIRQFSASVLALAGQDPKIMACEPRSLFNACLTAAALDLPINKNLGFAHIIPYENKKQGITEAQFQMGARGFRQLAQRTGQYKYIHESDVREGELKKRDRLSGAITFEWVEDDATRDKLPIIGYVSYFEMHNGFSNTFYMSADQLEGHALQYSSAYKWDKNPKNQYGSSSPWSSNRPAMSEKTVNKLNLSKYGFLSVDLQMAIERDQGVIRDDNTVDYVDGNDLIAEEVKATEDQKAAIIAANTEEGEVINEVPFASAGDAPDAKVAAAGLTEEDKRAIEKAEIDAAVKGKAKK